MMSIYLVSNNSLIDNIKYNDETIDLIRSLRLLDIIGEKEAKKLSERDLFQNAEKIYSSLYASAIDTAKYFSEKYDLTINLDKRLNDCKVGNLQNKTMSFLSNLQEHDFTYKMYGGESLNDVGQRLNNFIFDIEKDDKEIVAFTHRRCILGFLLKYCSVGYNLDDELILEYNNKVVYTKSDKLVDIYKIEINNNKIINIEII